MRPRPVHSPAYKILAEHLKKARLSPPHGGKKLTQIEVAERLCKPKSYPFKIENAERQLNALELVDYCEALEIDFFELMRAVIKASKALKEQQSSESVSND